MDQHRLKIQDGGQVKFLRLKKIKNEIFLHLQLKWIFIGRYFGRELLVYL